MGTANANGTTQFAVAGFSRTPQRFYWAACFT